MVYTKWRFRDLRVAAPLKRGRELVCLHHVLSGFRDLRVAAPLKLMGAEAQFLAKGAVL